MAAPTYGTDLTTVNLAESTTGWSAWGGGGAGLSASPDLALEGTNCVDKQITNAEKGQFHDNGSGYSPGTNDHFFIWLFCGTPGLIDTKANRGMMAVIGSSTSAYVKFHLTGSDVFDNTEVAKCWPIRYVNTASTGVRTLVGSPGTNPQVVGGGLKTTASVKGANLGVDGMRLGTGFYITAGDATTPGTFAGAASTDATSAYGILQDLAGAFQLQGRFVIGQNTSGTPTAARFEDSDATVFFTDTEHSLTDFTQIIVDHASTVFNLTRVTLQALGTNNPGRLVFNNASTVSALDACSFINMGISTLRAGVTATDCVWTGCDQITANGATMTGSVISGYEGAADSAALVWNTADDPNGDLDNSSFTKGTAATHAIEFGTSAPTSMTLTGIDFSGYNASDDQNDSTLNFLRTSGTTTLNLVGCSGNISIKTTGTHTVNVVINPVTTKITVKDSATKAVVQNVWVYLEAANGTGPLPYQDASTGWSRSGTTATVTLTAHGLETGNKVLIEPNSGTADNSAYGIKTITVTGANTFTYTMTDAGATTGVTVDITGVLISEATTALGVADDTRSLSGNQPVQGWARKHTTSPYYKESPISATVSSTNGLDIDVLVILDE